MRTTRATGIRLCIAGLACIAGLDLGACGRFGVPSSAPAWRVDAVRRLVDGANFELRGAIGVGNDAYVLLVQTALARRTAVLVRAGQHTSELLAHVALRDDATVSSLVDIAGAPAFAVAETERVRVLAFRAGALTAREFPRGEAPAGRAALTARVALGGEDRGVVHALLSWGDRFGTRRIQSRSVLEGAPRTPARPDVFRSPLVALLDRLAVTAYVRAVHDFEGHATGEDVLELGTLPIDPFATQSPATTRVISSRAEIRLLAIAPATSRADVDGAWLVFDTGAELRAEHWTPTPNGGWHSVESASWDTAMHARTRAAAIVPLSAPCGSLVVVARAGDRGMAVELRRVGAHGVGPPLVQADAVPLGDARVAAVPLGASRALVAWDDVAGVRAAIVDAAATCELSVRSLDAAALEGTRLVATVAAAGATHVVVHARSARNGHTSIVALRPDLTLGPALVEDVPEPVVRATATPGAVVLASRSLGGIRLRRVEIGEHAADPWEDDRIVRGTRGDDFAIAASESRHRVWAVEAVDTGTSVFGPAQTIVAHSFVEALEDGPRTETPVGLTPFAAFERVAMDRVELASGTQFALTFSPAGAASNACLPGIRLQLERADDLSGVSSAAASSGVSHGIVVGDPSMRSCTDRAWSVAWDGAQFAMIADGQRLSPRLIVGDVASGTMRAAALASALNPSFGAVTRAAGEVLAVWWANARGRATIVAAGFDDRVEPTTQVARIDRMAPLGAGASMPQRAIAAAPMAGGRAAIFYAARSALWLAVLTRTR